MILVFQKSIDAGEIWKAVRELYGPFEATSWMFTAREPFGGKSAVMMIKEGRADEVRRAISDESQHD
jgi:hypothetical protein